MNMVWKKVTFMELQDELHAQGLVFSQRWELIDKAKKEPREHIYFHQKDKKDIVIMCEPISTGLIWFIQV